MIRNVPGLLCAAWVAWLGWEGFPGAINLDSASQFLQSLHLTLNDWHPIGMQLVWWLLDQIWPSLGAMYLFVLTLYATAVLAFAVCWTRVTCGRTAVCVLLLFFPPFVAYLLELVKDSLFGAVMFITVVLILGGARATRQGAAVAFLVGAVLTGGLATLVRTEGVVPLFPLLVWGVATLEKRRPSTQARRFLSLRVLATSAVACAFLLTAGQLLTYRVFKTERTYPYQYFMIHDLAALSVDRGELLLPPWMVERFQLTMPYVAEHYTPMIGDFLIWPPGGGTRIEFTTDKAEASELASRWWAAIRARPGAYLHHRAAVFSLLLGLKGLVPWAPIHDLETDPLLRGHCARLESQVHVRCLPSPGPLVRWLVRFADRARNGLLFRGRGYLVLAFIVAFVAALSWFWGNRSLWVGAAAALAASALAHPAVLFWVGPGYLYRYLFWMMLSAVLSALALGVALAQKKVAT